MSVGGQRRTSALGGVVCGRGVSDERGVVDGGLKSDSHEEVGGVGCVK